MSKASGNNKGKMPTHGGKKTSGPRRSWTQREEKVLLCALKDIFAGGWKCDNGFKIGYLLQLEKLMCKEFPDTDLKAQPHINSKIHVWKKDYYTLTAIKGASGFGWDDTKKMIVVDSESVWNEFVKTDSNARTMKYKSFPFYDDWVVLFGKDKATGDLAEDCYTATKEPTPVVDSSPGSGYIAEMDTNNQGNYFDCDGVHNLFDDDHDVYSSSLQPLPPPPPQSQPTAAASISGSKRKVPKGGMDKVADLIGTFCETTKDMLSNITNGIGYEMNAAAARMGIFDELGRMPFLDLGRKVDVAQELIKDPKVVDLFFSMSDNAKDEIVRKILSKLV